uniref:disease resistance protein RUN1-like n=1 Tax=Erigeron canadensis TaxID=72917 RepID=UPI001CB99660|nr:disease resistance protein RUN1-like [Erigeron canadensis]
MASTSTLSVHKSFKYDVFISFRGEDTRKGFVGHLYDALQRQSIITYKDDERITKGKRISDELIGSIKDSRFYIIVFSKEYACSSWCLDELVKIMECQKTGDQRAYPVFFDVEPTEIRNQSGLVEKAFFKHEKDEAAGKWREALKEAADLAGWELKNTFDWNEAKLIKKVVREISLELRFIDSSVDEKLIGMESRVKGVLSTYLQNGSEDVRMIGIKGMGGGGKTTLARAIVDHISSWFEGKSFVANVRDVSKASLSGLKELQEQILSDVLNVSGIKISNVHDGKQMMKKRLRGRKVLVVLDDVDNIEQLEALAGVPDWFGAGSRIIITTRDEQVLVAHRVKLIHNVNLLSDEEAICLFSRYTFGKEIPIKGYEEHSVNVVRYAAGLPLTIKVLGSFLCGKTDPEWIDALERLKTIPLKDTLEKLELSYIGLEADYREIFLDVACMLKGWETEKAVEALESCGFHARIGLRVLEQKSLITTTTTKYGSSYLGMHDHIEEMGKDIVRRLHPNMPRMHSRLWISEEIKDILTNDSGNDEIQCIHWNWISNETYMKGLGNMKKLRVLDIFGEGLAIQCFPNALRYLQWGCYPFECLKKSFQADNLVGLSMPHSRIMQLWKPGERKVLHKLRFLDMRHSGLRTLELEMTPNIEILNLRGCSHLVELKMPLGYSKLKTLYLEFSGLRTLNLAPNPNLETLDLRGCKDLAEITMPYQCRNLKFLRANSSKLMTIDLQLISNLVYCHDLVEFHMPNDCPIFKALYLISSKLGSLKLISIPKRENLDLYGCHGLVELNMPSQCPKLKSLYLHSLKLRTLDLRLTLDLKILSVKECHDLKELHMPNAAPNLKSLILENSNLRKINLGLTPDLEMLRLEGCHDLSEFHFPYQFPKLKSFSLNGSKLRTLDFRMSSDLETLSVEECHELVELHIPNECPKLKYLNLKNLALKKLNIGSTPDLEMLNLKRCHDLVDLHMPFRCPKLKVFSLECSKLKTLYDVHTPDLETFGLEECSQLLKLHMPNEFPKLKPLSLGNSQLRSLNLGQTPDLKRLNIKECFTLVELCAPAGCLEKLDYICQFYRQIQSPVGSLHMIIVSVDTLPMHSNSSFQKFRFSCLYEEPISSSIGNLGKFISIGLSPFTNLESFSSSIWDLQGLKKLTLEGSFSEVPEDLGRLQFLEDLSLLSIGMKHLPDSICFLYTLKLLELNSCSFIERLPDRLGRLKCLEDLKLTSCIRLQEIPKSICDMKHLKCLNLSSCLQVKKLPRELRRLECLKELNIKDTGISDLPDGIFELEGLHIVASNGFSCTIERPQYKRQRT